MILGTKEVMVTQSFKGHERKTVMTYTSYSVEGKVADRQGGEQLRKTFMVSCLLGLCLTFSFSAWAQFGGHIPEEFKSDDLVLGGDIFNDFNEELETQNVLEDERFLNYGRFFTLNLGLGLTHFTGNRGMAYSNNPPTFNLGIMAFTDFQVSFLLGGNYSKHFMLFDDLVEKDPEKPLGLVDVSMLRIYTGFRYYIDTTDLNTALTYSNPYFTMRFEYWYVNNTFIDREEINDDTGGGTGASFGGGLEFPIQLKRSYINYEFLVHTVNFHDRLTRDYQEVKDSSSGRGHNDLSGLGVSNVVSYVINW